MARATVPRDTDAILTGLLHAERDRLLHLLRRLCGADAEDVLQETLTKVWRLRHAFDASQNGAAWLTRAALHTLVDFRARQRQSPRATEHLVEPASPATADALETRELVARCLAALPPVERTLLVAFHAHGASLRELAARHGMPVNTVKSHLHRARTRLAAFKEAQP